MRTTLDIPEDLFAEAVRVSGTKSKTSTVIISLQELINRRKIREMRAWRGKLDLDIDLDALRRNRIAP